MSKKNGGDKKGGKKRGQSVEPSNKSKEPSVEVVGPPTPAPIVTPPPGFTQDEVAFLRSLLPGGSVALLSLNSRVLLSKHSSLLQAPWWWSGEEGALLWQGEEHHLFLRLSQSWPPLPYAEGQRGPRACLVDT